MRASTEETIPNFGRGDFQQLFVVLELDGREHLGPVGGLDETLAALLERWLVEYVLGNGSLVLNPGGPGGERDQHGGVVRDASIRR
eukprot:4651080-Pyramimonas_sp.AAC.1